MDFKQFFENMEASVERTTQARDRAKQKAQKSSGQRVSRAQGA